MSVVVILELVFVFNAVMQYFVNLFPVSVTILVLNAYPCLFKACFTLNQNISDDPLGKDMFQDFDVKVQVRNVRNVPEL